MNLMRTKGPLLQNGFTLVELMVAMVVGLILMAGVLQIYLSSKQSDRVLTAEARMQENGRFAMHFLVHDLRMAGYMGCASINHLTPNVIAKPAPTMSFSSANIIRGFTYTAGSTWPSGYTVSAVTNGNGAPANIVPGTSVIAVEFGSSDGANLTGNVDPVNSNMQVTSNAGNWAQGSYVLVTDCASADLFRSTDTPKPNSLGGVTLSYGKGTYNTTNRLSRNYGRNAQTMSYESNTYYIGYDSNDPDPDNPKGRPALYRMDIEGNTQELVDNVQDINVLYGVDTTSDQSANEYLTAAQVNAANEWSNVVSVRLDLLMASNSDNLAPTPQPVSFGSGTYNPPDRRLYWTFGDTVALRNRSE